MMSVDESLRSMEKSFAEAVALALDVAPETVRVSLAIEAREGKEGVLIDVLVDGKAHAVAEEMVRDWLRATMAAAEQVTAIVTETAR